MRRIEPESVGDVLRQTLQEQGMTDRLYETKAEALWSRVVGEELAAQTSRPSVYKGKMTVYVRNASLRHELNMSRSKIVSIINEMLGREVIKELFFR